MYEDLANNLTEQANESDYFRAISVDLSIEGLEFENYELLTTEVGVEYSFDQEHRKEGIKDIMFILRNDVAITFLVGDEEKSVQIKADDVRVDWLAGSYYTPAGLSVYLTSELEIKEAAIDVFFISK